MPELKYGLFQKQQPGKQPDGEVFIPWLNERFFGCCSVDYYTLPNGDGVAIGAHA